MSRTHRVLIVEDHADTSLAMSWLLTVLGHQTRVVPRGREALAATRDFDPDIVMIDIGLPDISGYEVIQALRAADPHHARYLVAATGRGMQRDREHAQRAGFDEHQLKPLGLATVREVLRRAEQRTPQGLQRS